jgi:molecular chaperone DnaJ
MLGVFSTSHACTTCNGSGKVPKEECGECGGQGLMRREEEIVIAVPAGIEDGEMIRLSGGGEAVKGGVPGDLYVKVHVKNDQRYRRERDDLVRTLEVKLSDALLGATYKVDTVDGEISLKIPQGVAYGERLRVKGKGVPTGRSSARGDLYFEIKVHIPAKLSKAAQKAVETLRAEGV